MTKAKKHFVSVSLWWEALHNKASAVSLNPLPLRRSMARDRPVDGDEEGLDATKRPAPTRNVIPAHRSIRRLPPQWRARDLMDVHGASAVNDSPDTASKRMRDPVVEPELALPRLCLAGTYSPSRRPVSTYLIKLRHDRLFVVDDILFSSPMPYSRRTSSLKAPSVVIQMVTQSQSVQLADTTKNKKIAQMLLCSRIIVSDDFIVRSCQLPVGRLSYGACSLGGVGERGGPAHRRFIDHHSPSP